MSNNPVGLFEIYVQDIARAKIFYAGVLSLRLEKLNSPLVYFSCKDCAVEEAKEELSDQAWNMKSDWYFHIGHHSGHYVLGQISWIEHITRRSFGRKLRCTSYAPHCLVARCHKSKLTEC